MSPLERHPEDVAGQIIGALIMTLLFSLTVGADAPKLGLAIAASFALTAGLLSFHHSAQSLAYSHSERLHSEGGQFCAKATHDDPHQA